MKTLQALLSPLLCLILITGPVQFARADASADFHQVCDQTLAKNDSGDMALGDCRKAQLANGVNKLMKASSIIFGTATVVASAMIVVENSGYGTAAAKAVCLGLDAASAGKVLIDNKKVKEAGAEVIGTYANTVNSAVKVGVMGAGAMALKGLLFDGKTISQVMNTVNTVSKSGKTQTGCIMSAIGLGVLTSASIVGTIQSKNALVTSTNTAKGEISDAKNSASLNLVTTSGTPNNNATAPNNNPAVEYSCDSASGSDYTKCLSKANPEVAALTNNPSVMDSMNKALGGKNLGDFAKNYNGNSAEDAANYIAAGTGMSAGSVAALMDSSKKTAQAMGVTEAYKPGSYESASNSGAGSKGGADPMEKMLADMMKNMADPGSDGLGKDRNPASEIVFRQMDLLSPDKIAENKDISLFDRAHYRIQKNASNLEQLNSTR